MGNERNNQKGKQSEYESEIERLKAEIDKLKKKGEQQFDDVKWD